MNHDAYRDGWRAGRADRMIGQRSDYAWWGEQWSGYSQDYAEGYQAGWGRP